MYETEENILEDSENNELLQFTIEELEAEIEKRKQKCKIPDFLSFSKIDITDLRHICREYLGKLIDGWNEVEGINENEDILADYEHYIFEKAFEALYGKDIWDFINDRT